MVTTMIRLTRLSGAPFVLNADLIERVDATPDTVITLGDGTKYVAAEDIDTVVTAVRLHRAEIIALSEVLRVSVSEPLPEPDEPLHQQLASVTDLSAHASNGGDL
jgi:flagellar protein FlbD